MIVFSDAVLDHFTKNQQRRFWNKEAGGALFAKTNNQFHLIEAATGPFSGDKKGRHRFEPNRIKAQKEIERQFDLGLHYIGSWHTHPQPIPEPSSVDLRSIANVYQKSLHSLNAMLLVIIGTANFPAGLHVSLHDGDNRIYLTASQQI